MCERKDGSGFIKPDEARYICGILNTPIVEEFIYASSDIRSFKIRPPVYLPKYDKKNQLHNKIVKLTQKACKTSENKIGEIRNQIEVLYLKMCDKKPTLSRLTTKTKCPS
jgi:hypothetical protein